MIRPPFRFPSIAATVKGALPSSPVTPASAQALDAFACRTAAKPTLFLAGLLRPSDLHEDNPEIIESFTAKDAAGRIFRISVFRLADGRHDPRMADGTLLNPVRVGEFVSLDGRIELRRV